MLLQTLCAIEAQLENLLGSFHFTMAGEHKVLLIHKYQSGYKSEF